MTYIRLGVFSFINVVIRVNLSKKREYRWYVLMFLILHSFLDIVSLRTRDKRLLWSEMSVLRGVGSAIGLIACAVSVYSTITPYWAINIQNTGLQQMESKALGLWQFCIKAAASPNYQCQPLNQLGVAKLAEMGIVGYRAFMIVGMIMGIGGFFVALMSSNAINITIPSNQKSNMAAGAGVMFLIAAICAIAAGSWAANNIIRGYNNINWENQLTTAATQWTFGAGIYTAWVTGTLYLAAAGITLAGCHSSPEDEAETHSYQPGTGTFL